MVSQKNRICVVCKKAHLPELFRACTEVARREAADFRAREEDFKPDHFQFEMQRLDYRLVKVLQLCDEMGVSV